MTAPCPQCAANVALADNTEVGELLECDECGTELEVKNLAPATLEPAPEEEEDWGE